MTITANPLPIRALGNEAQSNISGMSVRGGF
jgi:hypothetical protein